MKQKKKRLNNSIPYISK